MGFRLRPGLTYCVSAGHTIFLDIGSDRYFGLPREAEEPFRCLIDRGVIGAPERRKLLPLLNAGLLLEDDEHRSWCPPVPIPGCRSRLIDDSDARYRGLGGRSMVAQCRAVMSSRRSTLQRIFERVRLGRSGLRRTPPDFDATEWCRIRCAFDRTKVVRPLADRCLVSSLAFLDVAFSRGLDAQLILGVFAAPFSAHCWVQVGDIVVNDRLDYVQSFTPIVAV